MCTVHGEERIVNLINMLVSKWRSAQWNCHKICIFIINVGKLIVLTSILPGAISHKIYLIVYLQVHGLCDAGVYRHIANGHFKYIARCASIFSVHSQSEIVHCRLFIVITMNSSNWERVRSRSFTHTKQQQKQNEFVRVQMLSMRRFILRAV